VVGISQETLIIQKISGRYLAGDTDYSEDKWSVSRRRHRFLWGFFWLFFTASRQKQTNHTLKYLFTRL